MNWKSYKRVSKQNQMNEDAILKINNDKWQGFRTNKTKAIRSEFMEQSVGWLI